MSNGQAKDEAGVALLERYQGFSAELLRLSLLGIALLGFFIDKVVSQEHFTENSKFWMLVFLGIAAALFACAAASALAHRYYATDGIFFRLEKLSGQILSADGRKYPGDRLRRLLNSLIYRRQFTLDDREHMIESSDRFAHLFMGLSASLAGVATFILVVGFVFAAFGFTTPPPKPPPTAHAIQPASAPAM